MKYLQTLSQAQLLELYISLNVSIFALHQMKLNASDLQHNCDEIENFSKNKFGLGWKIFN